MSSAPGDLLMGSEGHSGGRGLSLSSPGVRCRGGELGGWGLAAGEEAQGLRAVWAAGSPILSDRL